VQHEGVCVPTKLGDNKWYALSHQAGHKSDVARETIQLGDDYAALRSLRRRQRSGQLRASVQSIRSLPGFGLNIFSSYRQGFRGRKVLDRGRWASMPKPERC